MLIWRFFFCLLIFLPPYLEILGPSLLTIVLWVSWTFISLLGYKDQQYKEEAYQFLLNSMHKNKNAKLSRMYEGQTIYKYTCTNSKRVPQWTGKLFRICGTQKFSTCRCLIAVRPPIAVTHAPFSLEGYARAYEAETLGVMEEGCTSSVWLEYESILRKLIGQKCIDPLWWINWLISQVY